MVPKLYVPAERVPVAIRKPYAPDFTVAQVRSARDYGRTVQTGYGWAYGDLDPTQSARDWVDTATAAEIALRRLWIDVETYQQRQGAPVSWPSVAWVQTSGAELDRLGVPWGIYTAQWFVSGYWGGSAAFGLVPNWSAFYNEAVDLVSLPQYGGWRRFAGHQYSAAGVDRDIFDAALA